MLGQRTTGEEGLRVRRTWLWAQSTAKGALVLEFAAPGQHLALDLVPGTTVEAELNFYPSNYPLRAVLKKRVNTKRSLKEIGYPTSEHLLITYAEGLALNPWLEAIPAPLQTVVPVHRGEKWFAKDSNARLLSLRSDPASGWKLLALSGGYPITIFGEWNGRSLLPISAWADGRHIEL